MVLEAKDAPLIARFATTVASAATFPAKARAMAWALCRRRTVCAAEKRRSAGLRAKRASSL
jgi:hypothetical protein